jgi:pyruvate/2-oxoglutarate dehydrogenase complex dihydrolipoamide acyltransferase (E2) component
MSTVEVEIVDILVQTGQRVAVGDVLMTVAADKIDLTIEAEAAGTIVEILTQPGAVCEVGEIVARLQPGE